MEESVNCSALEYLEKTAGLTLRGMGSEDAKVFASTEAMMAKVFDRYLCGDGSEGLVAWNSDGTVSVYDGRLYVRHDAEYLKSVIKSVMEAAGVGEVYITNSVNKIYTRCMINVRFGQREFEVNRRYAVFRNCVLDLESGDVLGFSSEYATDLSFDYDYEPSARSLLWDNFIVRTIPSDEMRDAFQMFCGAFFTDRRKCKLEKACYLIGSGRNGKSVAVTAIAEALGSDKISSFSPQQLFTDNTAMYNRANADGKLANFSDDVKATDYSGGDFKQFVSGKPFEARRIYGQPYTMRSVPFMVLCVNAMPPTTDDTDGHYRRVLPIMCPNKVSDREADPMLESKLTTEECKQAIFNWMYEGYKMFVSNGCKIAESSNIRDIQEDLKADSNSARRWLRDTGYAPYKLQHGVLPDRNDEHWVSMKKLMEDYKQYCIDMAEPVKSQKSVGMILRELGYDMLRRNDGIYYSVERTYEDLDLGFGERVTDENLPF